MMENENTNSSVIQTTGLTRTNRQVLYKRRNCRIMYKLCKTTS